MWGCSWARLVPANWPPELNLAHQHVVFGLPEDLKKNFFKHLSQHLKIGSVYILKSVFLASTEILEDLATPAHIPTWKQWWSVEAAAPPEAREVSGPTPELVPEMGRMRPRVRSLGQGAPRTESNRSSGDCQAWHWGSCHTSYPGCLRAPSVPVLPRPQSLPSRCLLTLALRNAGLSPLLCSVIEPWSQVCNSDSRRSQRPSTVTSCLLDNEGEDEGPPWPLSQMG